MEKRSYRVIYVGLDGVEFHSSRKYFRLEAAKFLASAVRTMGGRACIAAKEGWWPEYKPLNATEAKRRDAMVKAAVDKLMA